MSYGLVARNASDQVTLDTTTNTIISRGVFTISGSAGGSIFIGSDVTSTNARYQIVDIDEAALATFIWNTKIDKTDDGTIPTITFNDSGYLLYQNPGDGLNRTIDVFVFTIL